MNPSTGHLRVTTEGDIVPQEYVLVPRPLVPAARMKLAGRNEAYVSLTSGGKLSRFAAAQRKAKRQQVRQSRKRNRH